MSVSFSDRLVEALSGRNEAEVARRVGIAKQTLSNMKRGAETTAGRALALADELGVNYRWLIAGEGPRSAEASDPATDSVTMPLYDPHLTDEYGRDPVEHVSVPRWLLHRLDAASGLWLARMPSDALPSVAREGDFVVCRDPVAALQDRKVYIFLVDGRPIVRRVYLRPDHLELRGEEEADTIMVSPDQLERFAPFGQVISAIALKSV